jgi:hypothetical protein
MKAQKSATSTAQNVKAVVLSCHSVAYLDEDKMDLDCPAKTMVEGYMVQQFAINGCEEKSWDYAKDVYGQSVPFIVAIKQADTGKKCLGKLEVLFP